jgi:two-component system, LuxR family, sensor kinase FixL
MGEAAMWVSDGRVVVSCREHSLDWLFCVSDNGPGIERRYFDKIFQIFQTLSTRDQSDTIGIGLTIVKKIVNLYGGKIWVESEVGKGSMFCFTFPKVIVSAVSEEVFNPTPCLSVGETSSN